jgi:hypothetical protein
VAEYDPVKALRALTAHGVRFVVIGGVAARLRGAPLLTQDVDVCPANDRANLEALAAALNDLDARLRVSDDPDGVPFPVVPEMLATAESWTLVTNAGDLDLVFRPAGSQGYADLDREASALPVAQNPPLVVQVASLADIIRTKEAAGREKDRAALPLLRRTLDLSP